MLSCLHELAPYNRAIPWTELRFATMASEGRGNQTMNVLSAATLRSNYGPVYTRFDVHACGIVGSIPLVRSLLVDMWRSSSDHRSLNVFGHKSTRRARADNLGIFWR